MSRIDELVAGFAKRAEHARIDFKDAYQTGRKIIGVYCGFMPCELVRAAGAIPVSLCGNDQAAIPAAEVDLPRAFCPLVKSSYGLAITDTCPFFHFSHALIGETTCDGKKKVFELLRALKPVHVMQLPFDGGDGNARSYAIWLDEVRRTAAFVEEVVGTTISAEALSRAIRESNETARLLAEVASYFTLDEPPMTWTQMLVVQSARDFLVDTEPYRAALRELAGVLAEEADAGTAARRRMPRVMITGTPIAPETAKVMRLAEEAGALVVCHDACSGIKAYERLIDEDVDPFEALARYTLGIPCACMSPNAGRVELLKRTVETYRVQGVIDTVWQSCHTFNVESTIVGRATREELGLPYLKIETDYSETDLGQLRTRIEAFVEQVAG